MKKIIVILTTILALGLLWYFWLKPQDYMVRAKVNSITGTVNQTLKSWSNTLQDSNTMAQQGGLAHLRQRISFGDSIHQYDWYISPLTDSTSKITVDIKDREHSFMNRLKIPFMETDLEKRAKRTVMDFLTTLKEHEESIKITLMGQEELPAVPCACVNVKGPQSQKAKGMMENYNFLSDVLAKNNIPLNGLPLIEVNHWDMEKDQLDFNFCYPIVETAVVPNIKNMIFKNLKATRGLKAVYNGNYITSDRAWYALLDHAKALGITVENKPLEFFFNNPNMGGDALRWKTEVFLPIVE
jgi:effector-binding domain-containing protein